MVGSKIDTGNQDKTNNMTEYYINVITSLMILQSRFEDSVQDRHEGWMGLWCERKGEGMEAEHSLTSRKRPPERSMG